ncbi:mannosyltransferase [Coemansia sp. RSA 2704]|nr:mannosyltransferase [Coemansia sp. RSA 2704]
MRQTALRQRHSVKQERASRQTQKRQRKAQQQAASESAQTRAVEELDMGRREYVPSLSVVFRLLALMRVCGALLAPLQDCDEVYNYWEPLHFVQFGTGKQTWEYAPQYALRSYAYLRVHDAVIWAMHFVFGFAGKAQAFYALRVGLALASALSEAVLVRRVAAHVGARAANCTALALFGMAGLFHAAPALLPSSFAMCLCTLGAAAAMAPPAADLRRHLRQRAAPATAAFVLAAVGGWPYAGVAAVPFVAEELLVQGVGNNGGWWRARRLAALALVGGGTAGAAAGAMAAVDAWHYGRPVAAAWNQVAYNVLGQHGGSAALYGTEPWHFYVRNGLLNANAVLVLALAALPLWAAHAAVLRAAARSAGPAARPAARRLERAHVLLLFRIAPFPVALAAFSLHPHKEERFLSIVYPHMCFSAAAALGLVGALRTRFGSRIRFNSSRRLDVAVLAVAACVGMLRMAALVHYHAAPVRAFAELRAHAETTQTEAARLLPLGPSLKMLAGARTQAAEPAAEQTLCMGGAWHRFSSAYWLPRGFRLQFVRELGADAGQLPGDFEPVRASGSVRASTAAPRADFNARNAWEPGHVVELGRCDYVVEIEYGERRTELGGMEIRDSEISEISETSDAVWRRVGACHPVLDSARSGVLLRTLYVPPGAARLVSWATGQQQAWARMCVYRRDNIR